MPQAQPELKKVPLLPPPPLFSLSPVPHLQTQKRSHANKKFPSPRKQYLDKRLFVQLNGSRKVIGVLRGYDVRVHPRIYPRRRLPSPVSRSQLDSSYIREKRDKWER